MLELKAKVGAKGQAVIPKPIRDKLGIKPGDEVSFSLHGEHADMRPATPSKSWDEIFAMLPKSRHDAGDWDDEIEKSYEG